MEAVKFNNRDQAGFFRDLRRKVNAYFKENNISRYANTRMVVKTIVMLLLYFVPFIFMLFGGFTSFWVLMGLWVVMGFGMAGIGLSIMHDANHQAYSRNKKVNNALGFLINFVGGYHKNWIIQHNVLHHSYTNIDGFDEDIETPIMRFSPEQKSKKMYRYQAFYGPFLYGLMTLNWLLYKDFSQLLRYKKNDLISRAGTTFPKAITGLIFNKLWYILILIVLPIIMVNAPWWYSIIGFLLMHFITGVFLSLVFQSAHVIDETLFCSVDAQGSVENSWAIHQMRTTANFANKSVILSWFIGGLNFQIEHHLFPNICHVHYKKISKIVREVAEDYNIPYYEHKTFLGAIRSHFKLVHDLGTGKYDKWAEVKVRA